MGKSNIVKLYSIIPLIAILVIGVTPAFAGPVIIDGTDSPDHGERIGDTPVGNWPYIQNAIKSLLEDETRAGPHTVDILTIGSKDVVGFPEEDVAGAIKSAADKLGVTVEFCGDPVAAQDCFDKIADGTINPRVLYFGGTGSDNDVGDNGVGPTLTANAQVISDFVAAGGGVLSHGSGDTALGWLSVLLPDIEYPEGCETLDNSDNAAYLTDEGKALFPDITDDNIQGFCHNHFTGDFGGLVVLARDGLDRALVLGLAGGTDGSIEEGVVDGPITEIQCSYDESTDVILNGVLEYSVGGSCDIYRGDDMETKNMTLNVMKELTPLGNSIEYSDFSSTSGLVLNSAAEQVGNVLRVAPTTGGVGSVFYQDKVDVSEFNTQFQLRFSDPDGFADGLTFVIQNDSDGVNAIGGGGGGIGYNGLSPSLAASFDIWVNGSPCETSRNISILSDGEWCSPKLTSADFYFYDDVIYNIWIDYDGITYEIFISETTTKPVSPIVSKDVDIASIIGSNMGYIGFTASTGAASANHDILNWSFNTKGNEYSQTGMFEIVFTDESGSIKVNEDGSLSMEGSQIQFDGIISSVDDDEFEPVPQCGDVNALVVLNGDYSEPQNNSIRILTIPSNSASGTVSINQCPTIERTNNGGDNQWDTRPTFGVSHETRQGLIVENGFSFNGDYFTVTDNHHTDFAEQSVEIGTMNSFTATVYADKKLKVQEFLFGIPNVGESHLAELGIEVWYDRDGAIEDIVVDQDTAVIDEGTISVSHEKTKCLSTDPEPLCDTTTVSMTFLEPLADKVMAVKAIDYALRDQRTYLNDGFDVSGESLNPMLTQMIPSNVKNQGLLEVTQLAKYSPYWQSADGRMFEMNSFGSFKEINKSFERFQDTGNAFTRLHSGFGGILDYEQNRATQVFDSTKLISDLPDSFGYHFSMRC
jgi:hypothetical protein